jgi:FHA domain
VPDKILDFVGRVDQKMQERINQFFERGVSLEPLDVQKQVLRQVEDQIVTLSSGERAFPFVGLTIAFYVPDEKNLARFDTAFRQQGRLAKAITNELTKKLGAAPNKLAVELAVLIQAPPEGVTDVFVIDYVAPEAAAGKHAATKAMLIVLRGQAVKKRFAIERDRIYIGRLPEIVGKDGRVARRNDFYFLDDGSDVNQTVSREHAQIRRDKATGEHRISDDLSAYGTIILRDGQRHEVPRRRGMKLRAGDEIYFGEACVRFTLT